MSKKIKLPIKYHKAQADIFYNGTHLRGKCIAKGRRFGLTRGFANFCIEKMLDGLSPLLWVDTINSNVDRYVERYFLPVLNNLPSRMWKWRQQKKELAVGNSVLDFRSADIPENIEGFGYALIILNEAGIILKDESLYYNTILPMILDYKASILCGGTPKGKNLFYRLCMQAKKKKDWRFYHYTSYDNPFLSKEEIDALCENMPDLVRRQEIMAEFLSDSSVVFSNYKNCIKGELQAPVSGQNYYAGLDLARLRDWTCLIIVNTDNHVCFFGRVQHHSWNYQKQWVHDHLKRYNNASCKIDSTGIGDVIYDDLSRAGINLSAYKFTAESKKQLIESLMLAIEQEKISYPEIRELSEELEVFEYQTTATGVRYSAPSGFHDDTVIALALANMWNKQVATWDEEMGFGSLAEEADWEGILF